MEYSRAKASYLYWAEQVYSPEGKKNKKAEIMRALWAKAIDSGYYKKLPSDSLKADEILWEMYSSGEWNVGALDEETIPRTKRHSVISEEKSFIAMRVGDLEDYHLYSSPYDAGFALGKRLAPMGKFNNANELVRSIKRVEGGVEVKGLFQGYNYVSVYKSGKEYEWLEDLDKFEYEEFIRGVKEGFNAVKGKVVMRIGDGGDYEFYDSLYEAGYELGLVLAAVSPFKSWEELKDNIRRKEERVYVDGVFDGHNYISLYIGDENYEWIRDLTKDEFEDFLFGVEDAFKLEVREETRAKFVQGRSRLTEGRNKEENIIRARVQLRKR